jgi:hypothetical protein
VCHEYAPFGELDEPRERPFQGRCVAEDGVIDAGEVADEPGDRRPGATSVSNTPIRSPPRYFTAPISVIRESAGDPPVVSRSTMQKVTSWRGIPSCKVV